jgi:hypothetical protein
LIKSLRDILWATRASAGRDFSGIGMLISDRPNELPIFPIRPMSTFPETLDLTTTLASISVFDSEFHDGFHIVSSSWQLTRVAQYFSPPIIPDATIDRSKLFGGRYLAALFGSALPDVKLAGVASDGFGVAIFEAGRERHFEPFND